MNIHEHMTAAKSAQIFGNADTFDFPEDMCVPFPLKIVKTSTLRHTWQKKYEKSFKCLLNVFDRRRLTSL